MTHWWQDPAVEPILAAAYVNTTFLLLGVYGWEYFQSFGVEYAVLRGRLPFRWPLVPYLVGRISLLIAFLLLVVEMSPFPEHDFACQTIITFTAVTGDLAIGASSANFVIRTWVIWKNSRWMHLLLSFLTLGQCAILILDATNVKAFRLNGACVIHLTHSAVTAGVFVYTTSYDFLVLGLSILKLSRQPSTSPLKDRLYAQGILYFSVAAMTNVLPTVFSFLGSDALVGITGSIAMTASTIVSCRAVRSLLYLRISHKSGNAFRQTVDIDVALTTQLATSQMSTTLMEV